MDPRASVVPRRALAHPLWLAALVVLALNDHVLKGAGLLPGWLTGKLSDFAGLLVAPAVLAVLARVRSRQGWIASHLVIGVGFATIKASRAASDAFERALGVVNVADPTDLIALSVLPVSIVLLGRASRGERATSPALERALAIVGALFCMATQPPRPPPGPAGTVSHACFEAFHAALYARNVGPETVTLTVRVLKADAQASCAAIVHGADPCALRPEMLGPATALTLRPGENAPIPARGCNVAVVSMDPWLAPALVARASDPTKADLLVPRVDRSGKSSHDSPAQGAVIVDASTRSFSGLARPWLCEGGAP